MVFINVSLPLRDKGPYMMAQMFRNLSPSSP